MYAKLIIVGNLGGDPEMRYVPDGTPVTNFSVAVNRRWNNADGSPGEETLWFRCTAWRKTTEVVNQYLSKGRQVLVEGRLRPDENGNPRVFTRNDGSAAVEARDRASPQRGKPSGCPIPIGDLRASWWWQCRSARLSDVQQHVPALESGRRAGGAADRPAGMQGRSAGCYAPGVRAGQHLSHRRCRRGAASHRCGGEGSCGAVVQMIQAHLLSRGEPVNHIQLMLPRSFISIALPHSGNAP